MMSVLSAQKTAGKVSFITTCKGRLHHLKETLPLIVAQKPDEIIVVDHNCPQNTGSWVENNFPRVNVVYIKDDAPFVVSKARNIGIRACKGDIVCLIDADILINPGFVDWIRLNAAERRFFRQELVDGKRNLETWGTFICPHDLLLEVGLYDEAFDGWGGEDDDLYYRLKISGSIEDAFPAGFVEAIAHDNHERFSLYDAKDKVSHLLMNRLYSEAKRIALALDPDGRSPPLEWRKKVRSEIKKAVLQNQGQRLKTLHLALNLALTSPFLFGYEVKKNVSVKLSANRIHRGAGGLNRTT